MLSSPGLKSQVVLTERQSLKPQVLDRHPAERVREAATQWILTGARETDEFPNTEDREGVKDLVDRRNQDSSLSDAIKCYIKKRKQNKM